MRHSLLAGTAIILASLNSAAVAGGVKNGVQHLDFYGDPLPEHALFRIGTSRLRTGRTVQSLAFTADGKGLVTAGEGIHLWEVRSGKDVSSISFPNSSDVGAVSADGMIVAALTGRTASAESMTRPRARNSSRPLPVGKACACCAFRRTKRYLLARGGGNKGMKAASRFGTSRPPS
jgi:hypothetical protein